MSEPTARLDPDVWKDIHSCMDESVFRRLNQIVDSASWQELVWDLVRPVSAAVDAIPTVERWSTPEDLLSDAGVAGSAHGARA